MAVVAEGRRGGLWDDVLEQSVADGLDETHHELTSLWRVEGRY